MYNIEIAFATFYCILCKRRINGILPKAVIRGSGFVYVSKQHINYNVMLMFIVPNMHQFIYYI